MNLELRVWQKYVKWSLNTAYIRLDEDVSKKSFVFVVRRRLNQDKYTRLDQTSWRRPIKTFSRCLAKTSLRHLARIPSRPLQDVFKMYHQVKTVPVSTSPRCLWDVFNTFLRHTAKMIIYRKTSLSHTHEKPNVRVHYFREWALWIYQNF